MGVPPKGTQKYVAYLRKQMLRKRKERAIEKRQRVLKLAKPYIKGQFKMLVRRAKAAKREMVKAMGETEKAKIKGNIHWRNATKFQAALKQMEMKHKEEVKAMEKNHKEDVKAMEKKHKEEMQDEQDKTRESEKERIRYEKLVSKWSWWWHHVRSQASAKTLAFVYKLGRPPRNPDHGWGGGQ